MYYKEQKVISGMYLIVLIIALICLTLLLFEPPSAQADKASATQKDSVSYFKRLASIGQRTSSVDYENKIRTIRATSTTTTTTTLKQITVKPGRPTPPVESPSYEPGTIEALIAESFPVNPALWIAIARCESGLNPNSYNAEGASGLFQIMMPLHKDMLLPGENIYDPHVNIRIALSLSHGGTQTGDWNSSSGCWR